MAIDFDAFLRWAEDKFDSVLIKNDEIKINSIFIEDRKHHLSCSPSGGKHKRKDGCYRCWKTDKRGTLTSLVMQVEGCTYEESQDILGGATSLRVLEERLHEFFAEKEKAVVIRPESKIKLPDETYPICDLSTFHRQAAENYIIKRHLSIDGLYYCISGEYYNRIVIPYYDRDGKLIYFNSRDIGKSKLRYKGPPKTIGVGKGDVLFALKWPPSGSKIHLTEGEFDAMTLNVCGFYGMACGGKNLSDKQLDMLRQYKVCLCLDTDNTTVEAASPGLTGIMAIGQKLVSAFISVTFVRPPRGIKDWNNMLVILKNPDIIMQYINKYEKPFDALTLEQLMCIT